MRASYNWLRELSGVDASPAEVRERLTRAGLEVEAADAFGEGLDRVVVGEVRASRRHPERDKISIVTVFDGETEQEVICGAPNVPAPGGRVLFARLGATLPGGMEIAERKIAGVVSRGMICSEVELGIGPGEEGIFVFDAAGAPRPGERIDAALPIRDTVFEVSLTPNRPDCLGHLGLAREVALAFGEPFEPKRPRAPELVDGPPSFVDRPENVALAPLWAGAPAVARLVAGEVDVRIESPERCPRYGAALVLGVAIAPSPFWLRHRLHVLGLRPISNVVDVTNYVLLEHGHPIHGFDLARVRRQRIVVRLARDGEKMATLDGIERTFTSDDLLICDGEGPVAVAGVMGGANSEIGDDTRDVLIECAYFDPRSVRRTARRLGLHTDASHRFERGVDPSAVPAVLARASSLMAEVCGGAVVARALDVNPRPIAPASLRVRYARARSILGIDVSRDEARRTLEGIGCVVRESGDDHLDVDAPTFRPDLAREIDLIEEIGRVGGYERIPAQVPSVSPSAEGTPERILFVRRAREASAAAGLYEAVTYSFVSRRELEAARAPLATVELANPLSEERSVMRTSLLPGLAAAARHAWRRQATRVALFEVGHTFHPAPNDTLPVETRRLGVLLVGARGQWIGEGEPFDFWDGKGYVQAIVRPLLGVVPETVLDDSLDARAPWLHPRRRATIRAAGIDVGSLGELHPEVADALELEARAIYAEIDVGLLLEARVRTGVPQARALPRFPAVVRDIAMVVGDEHPASAIAEALRAAAKGLAESVTLFDLYRGKPVPEGKKSVAFRIVYRDPDETLTDKRVDAVHAEVSKAAEARFGAALRA